MASVFYTSGKLDDAVAVWAGSTVEVLLVRDTYTPDAAHTTLTDVIAHEVSGGNYVRKTLASKTRTDNTGASRCEFTAATVTYNNLRATAGEWRYAIYFRGTALVLCQDYGVQTPAGLNYTLTPAASGIFYRDLISEAFTGADSAVSMGGAWTNQAGTWGLASNKGYSAVLSGTRAKATHAGLSGTDVSVEVVMSTMAGTTQGMFLRSSGHTGILFLANRAAGNKYQIFDQTAQNSFTLIVATASGSYAVNGDVVRADMVGNSFVVRNNGVQVHSGTSSTYSGQTGVGLYSESTSARFDDFRAEGAFTIPTATVVETEPLLYTVNEVPTPESEYVFEVPIEFDWLAGTADEVDESSITLEIDGDAVPFTSTAIADGFHVFGWAPFIWGATHTVETTAYTDATPGSPVSSSWYFSVDGYGNLLNAPLDFYAQSDIPSDSYVDGYVPAQGPDNMQEALLDGVALEAFDPGAVTFANLFGRITLRFRQLLPLGIQVGEPQRGNVLPAGVEVQSGGQRIGDLPTGVQVHSQAVIGSLPAGIETTLHVREALPAGVQVGEPIRGNTLPAAVEVEGASTEGVITFDNPSTSFNNEKKDGDA